MCYTTIVDEELRRLERLAARGDLDAEQRLATYYLRIGRPPAEQPPVYDLEAALIQDGFTIILYDRTKDDVIATRPDIRFRTRRWDNLIDIAFTPNFDRWADSTLYSAPFPWDEEMYAEFWKEIEQSLGVPKQYRANPVGRMGAAEQKKVTRLAKQNADMIAPLQLGALLGCGEFGCVFQTSDSSKVFKVGSQISEYRVAHRLITARLTHPSLPKMYVTAQLEGDYYGLVREQIQNIQFKNIDWFNNAIADFEHLSEDPESCEELTDNAVKVLEETPGDPHDEVLFEKFLELAIWSYHHGITFGDLHAGNFGEREPGNLVLRDLGGAYLHPR